MLEDRAALKLVVKRAYEVGRRALGSGAVANYIPELANASPGWFGVAVHPLGAEEPVTAGDADLAFSLQSVSKIFSLACLLSNGDDAVFDRVGVEPSGDAFHSIVRLEEEQGRPRNPLINAGAIVVSGRLPGATVDEKILHFQNFLRGICPKGEFTVDEDVYRSEWRTGFRNRSLANYMRHFEIIDDPMLTCETYIRQCAIQTTATDLARMGLFLANAGTARGACLECRAESQAARRHVDLRAVRRGRQVRGGGRAASEKWRERRPARCRTRALFDRVLWASARSEGQQRGWTGGGARAGG